MNLNQIRQELSDKEIAEIDFRIFGNTILSEAKQISHKFNEEIVPTICSWLKDDRFADKLKIVEEKEGYDWAAYKKQQREFTERQIQAATQNLRAYHEAIRRKKEIRNELQSIIGTRTRADPDSTPAQIDSEYFTGMFEPFSPIEQHQAELNHEFHDLLQQSIPSLLPWRTLIISEISKPKSFKDLHTYVTTNLKADKIAKLHHLLQMASDGRIDLHQESHEGDILITPCEDNKLNHNNQDVAITIKDQHGNVSQWNWQDLSENQKRQVLTDTINRKIICKSA